MKARNNHSVSVLELYLFVLVDLHLRTSLESQSLLSLVFFFFKIWGVAYLQVQLLWYIIIGQQGWCHGESNLLQPMCPEFNLQTWRCLNLALLVFQFSPLLKNYM